MRRRDFVRAMLAASVSARTMIGQNAPASVTPAVPPPIPPQAAPLPAPGPVPWMRGLMEAKPLPMTPLVPDAVAHTQTRLLHPAAACNAAAALRGADASIEKRAGSDRCGRAGVSGFPDLGFARGPAEDVRRWAGPAGCRGKTEVRRSVCRRESAAGRCTDPPLAADVDDRSSSDTTPTSDLSIWRTPTFARRRSTPSRGLTRCRQMTSAAWKRGCTGIPWIRI